jgi:hypothetical protein
MKSKLIFLLLPAATILFGQSVSGQNSGTATDQMKQMHRETLDDPYLPNAYNNQRTSPAYRYTNRVKSNPQHSSIRTTQVNVNANGQNILGDAANEPSIAVNPRDANNIVIGWRQFDNIASNFRQAGWGYTMNGGETWTFPGVIEPGIFRSDPVLDWDADGNIFYNSLTNSPDYFCKVFESSNGGVAWDAGTDAHGGDKQWMVIDRTDGIGRGNIYSTWSYYFSTCVPGFATRSADHNRHYENCFTVDGSPYWCTMAIGNSGELYIGGASGMGDSLVVSKSVNANVPDSAVTWNKRVMVYIGGTPNGWSSINPVGLLGQISIDVDHSEGPGRGNVYLLAPVTRASIGDPCDVMFTRSTDGGLTWSNPMRINDDESVTNTQWFGTMSVAPDGRIDAIWLDTRNAPAGSDSSALYYSFSTDQGKTWSVNEKLSASFNPHVGYPNQDKLGDYFDMVSDNSGAHLAWANTLNGEQDVYYSRIIPYSSTGVNEITLQNTLSVFPNPVSGTMMIRGLTEGSRIEIYSLLGSKIHSDSSMETEVEMDISAYPAGIYSLKVISTDGSITIKKIIRK